MELGHNGRVFHIAVGAGLVELMRAQSCPRHGAVGLNGVSLVQHALLVQLRQQPPHRLHVLGVVGHVRCVHVHPVAHLTREVVPLRGVAHHRLAACVVVFLDRQLGADVFFGDAELLFHAQLHRESVGVPSRFPLHTVSFQRLEPAENVLDGPRHHVVNARLSVGRRGAFKKHIGLVRGPAVHALLEGVFAVPQLEPLLCEGGKVQGAAFRKFQRHGCVLGVVWVKCMAPRHVTARAAPAKITRRA